MPPLPRIGLVGPDRTQPCGIADFTERLADALGPLCQLAFVPFRDALASRDLEGCRGILVQYERSLVPASDFMARLGARHPGKVYVVPHEVYREDPFAFPYASLRSAFPPWLWLKQAAWHWRHRAYAREQRLQAGGYGAHRVIPLSGPGAEILRALAPGKVLDPVPHPYHIPADGGAAPRRDEFFPSNPRAILGIFGFLNPGLDYAQVFDLLEGLDPGVCLLLLGGSRGDAGMKEQVEREAEARGLGARVRITGFIPPDQVGAHLALCDIFLCPMRFKSNSGSLLHLFHLVRPILAPDLPLTRWLKTQGAPIDLYADATGLRAKVSACLAGASVAIPNHYAWDFPAAARAYLRAMGAAGSARTVVSN
jgi:glycosyltransferase involved in cell wall biosynthesis